MDEMARAGLLVFLTKIDAASNGATSAASNEIRAFLGDEPQPQPRGAGAELASNQVKVLHNKPWQNFQGNLSEKTVERQYILDKLAPEAWKDGVHNVSAVIKESEANGRSLRPAGSTWSSSPVLQTPLYLLSCGGLSGPGPAIDAADLAPGVDPAQIAHVQAGTVIQSVNELLEGNGQSLQVMGGNGGQNIAGAVATGTHGSWIDRKAVADYVLAIALVGAGGQKYWIEPQSRPLTKDTFNAWGVFTVVRDDALFAAAQVSVGSLGVVTSLVLDVLPLYHIQFARVQRSFDAPLQKALRELDLSGLDFSSRPAHFEVVLNPYQLGAGQPGAFMETGFVVSTEVKQARVLAAHQVEISEQFSISDAIWNDFAWLLSEFPCLVPHVLDLILPHAFPPMQVTGTLSQVWPMSTGGPPLISTEFAVPQEKAGQTLDLLLSLLEKAKPHFYWPGVFGVRFGAKTGALLGFTRFDRWCTMELLYLRNVKGVSEFLKGFYEAMRAAGIEHALHWGQVNFLDADQVLAIYGKDALAQWQAARRRLGADGQTFANETTNAWGLTSPPRTAG